MGLCPPSKTARGTYESIVDPEEFAELSECPADLLNLLREPGQTKAGKKTGHVRIIVADNEGHTLADHPGAGSGHSEWLSDCSCWQVAEVLKPTYHLWAKYQNAPS